jgi:hypothetical protein|tara:strand:- start:1031 stop:1459 length:429 start_codon:yes stop_codon:yes gene_type:complete
MFAEIALQTILAAIVGAIWLTPLVVSPAARSSLDEEALKFFLKTFFFRFHLFIVILLFAYLSIVYFFQLTEYELIWSSTKNLVMLILLGANTINLLLSLIINNVKIDTSSLMFRVLHGLSVAIFASTSFVSLYYLIEKFISL